METRYSIPEGYKNFSETKSWTKKFLRSKKKKKEKDNEIREIEEKLEEVQIKYSDTLVELDHIRKSQPPTKGEMSHRSSVAAQDDHKETEATTSQIQLLQNDNARLTGLLAEKEHHFKDLEAEIKKLQENLEHEKRENEAKTKHINELNQQATTKQPDNSYLTSF